MPEIESSSRDHVRVDGVVISYPKSGRTWVRFIFRLAGVQMLFDHAGADTGGHYAGRPIRRLEFDAARFGKAKVVLLHRDPLDTVVSNYMQMHKRELPSRSAWQRFAMHCNGRYPPESIDDFAVSSRYGVEKICRFNIGWARQLARWPDGIALSYERLSADTEGGIARLLEFLCPDRLCGLDVAELVRNSSFSEMKKVEAAGGETGLALTPEDPNDPDSFKVRRGMVGGYADYLRPETIEKAGAIMNRLSYDEIMASLPG